MSKFPIPYYYIWSDDYKIFSDILNIGITAYPNLFINRAEYITQEFFDKHLNKAKGHFLCGCFLKLYKTYELLKTLPENSYFIFSDADILILPNKNLEDLFNLYIKLNADIVFMREKQDSTFANIGFSLIRVCDANKKLFEDAITLSQKDPTGLDGTFINQALGNYTGSLFLFPSEFVMTSSTFIGYEKRPSNIIKTYEHLMIFQALCNPENPKHAVQFEKLSQFRALGFPIQFENDSS
jgi:hypothetical protein